MPYRWFTLTIATALFLSACKGCASLMPEGGNRGRATLITTPAANAQTPTMVQAGGTPPAGLLESGVSAPILSQGGAQLQGTLRAPAHLLSNHGGQMVGNNAGSMLDNDANNRMQPRSGSYRGTSLAYGLATASAPLDQQPLASVTVEAFDAVGNPLLDQQGQPIRTTSDATGKFVLTQPLPPENVVLSATIPGGKGVIQAIATQDTRAQTLQADLFSTLTTAYIVGRYVASQSAQQTVLNRLSGDIELETRQRTEMTFRSLNPPLPDQLDTATAIATTAAWRQADKTLDLQLEKVGKLLMIAP